MKIYLVVTDCVHCGDLLLQPAVELKPQLPSIDFEARRQRPQLGHQDLQTGAKFQLLCYDVHF